MFTFFDCIELLGWIFARVVLPCALVYFLWFFLRRIAVRKFRWLADFLCCLLFCAALLGVVWLLVLPTMSFWPPHWLERVRQRQMVYERARSAGGWELIKKEANDLVRTNAAAGFTWLMNARPKDNPPLPTSLRAMQPRRVDFWYEKDGMCSVRLVMFGAQSTGGRGQDFYSIKVVCPHPPDTPRTFKVESETPVNYGDRKITDGIYEVTRPG